MQHRLARIIVRFRIFILIALLLLAVFSAGSIGRTRINYDLNRYLSDDTMTKRALKVMEEEFGSTEQLRLMFENIQEEQLSEYVARLNAHPDILVAQHDRDAGTKVVDGVTCSLVTLTLTDCDAQALVREMRGMFPDAGTYYVGGPAAGQLDVQSSVAEEMPLVMAISLVVVIAVLLMTSRAWLEPLVTLLVLAVSIVINLGTHFLFPDVSFITFAVSAILQLALSIDYAIMLLHTFHDCRDEGREPRDAMTEALSQCFMRISSSALTTVAGLLSLLFMSFTIGFDIGLALSKGILISMLCVFLLMPAMILIFEKPLQKTRHRPLSLHGDRLGAAIYGARRIVAAVMIVLVACGAILQGMVQYTFTDGSARGATQKINEVFGSSSPLVLLIPGGQEDEDYDAQRALVERLQAIELDGVPAIREVSAMVTTGAEALKYYTPKDVADLTGLSGIAVNLFFLAQGFGQSVRADKLLQAADALNAGGEQVEQLKKALDQANAAFHGPRYDRMLLELSIPTTDRRLISLIDEIQEDVRESYGEDFYITGVPMSTYDIGNAFQGDLLKVNLITFLAILLIVTLSFRSLRLPLLLVFVIEGAIWITMGLSRVIGQPIFFISYLICVSIQMGATIDYGILLSDQYVTLRRAGQGTRDALLEAMKRALPTILTSGIILITAGFIIGKQCSVFYIADIGSLLSRGALVSVILILSLLPSLLCAFDGWIMHRGQKKTEHED
ncbi:MAG: MMPL family transporter [Clostridia bacterium]|nr:MMPL family transporter [Clostridia bacterium]